MKTDSYCILWIGTYFEIGTRQELESVTDGSHPMVLLARKYRLGSYCDRFSFGMRGDPVYTLLIGKNLAMLGHKEGITKLWLNPAQIQRHLQQIEKRFVLAGLKQKPRLFLGFHAVYET